MLKKYLLKKYAPNGDYNAKAREKLGQSAALVGILLNVFLFAIKLVAGLLTASLAIISDAVNNLSDAASSVVTFVGFKLANAPAHKEHPFGHGRMEYIAGLIVSMMIIMMGFELAKEAVGKILHPQAIEFSWLGLGILLSAILVKFWMAHFNRSLGKTIQSPPLLAVAADSMSDVMSTAVVAVGLLIFRFTGYNIDAWLGLLVAALVMYNGVKSAKETLDPLLGEAVDEEMFGEIKQMALAVPEIIGVHDLLVHNYGPSRCIISLHAEVDSSCDMLRAHECMDLLEQQLAHRFQCDAVIHLDPLVLNDELTEKIYWDVKNTVKSADERMNIHDFRMVKGTNRFNLLFDVAVPFEIKADDEAIREDLQNRLQQLNEEYAAIITIERM